MVSDETPKKKTSKKKASKKASKKKASKKAAAPQRPAAAASPVEATRTKVTKRGGRKSPRAMAAGDGGGGSPSHVDQLAEVGMVDPRRLLEREIDVINNEFTQEEVSALISAHKKLAPDGGPIAFVCF